MLKEFVMPRSSSSHFFKAWVFLFTSVFIITAPAYAQSPALSTGTVLESRDASGYTYVHVDTGVDKLWFAIPQTQVKRGEMVVFQSGMIMENFYSKTLDTTFPSIIFSPGLEGKAGTDQGQTTAQLLPSGNSFADAVQAESGSNRSQTTAPAQESGGSTGAIVPYTAVKVEKFEGENGYTVAEIFQQADQLNGKKVRIRGKVVKFNPAIMGKNWIHIQDGSGDPMKNTHDLVATSSGEAKVDEIIIIEGQVTAKKDFGFGYSYEALIEEAAITR
jgi:hypothetical protein